jgi:RNA polymerase sigma factor (sigma-70 family)
MTDLLPLHHDPSIRRLQQAFAHEEPATELLEVLLRAARYLAVAPRDAGTKLPAGRDLSTADLAAARRRDPTAVAQVYTAYAPALYRFFLAAVGDRHTAEDLSGGVFASAIEGLPGFRGPVEALGGWLFRIARHDLMDFRRKQARSPGAEGSDADIQALLQAIQALLDSHDPAPPTTLPQLVRQLLSESGRATDAALIRLSPREREVLALLGRGWGIPQIGRELLVSPHTTRTHLQNILVKLQLHLQVDQLTDQPQGAAVSPGADDPEEATIQGWEASPVLAAVQQLAADQREVLLLRMAAGLTAPEVAAVLHKTTGAIKALQHRALTRLADLLRQSGLERPGATLAMQVSPWLRPPTHRSDRTSGRDAGPPTRAD